MEKFRIFYKKLNFISNSEKMNVKTRLKLPSFEKGFLRLSLPSEINSMERINKKFMPSFHYKLPMTTKYCVSFVLPNGDILLIGSYWSNKTYLYEYKMNKYTQLQPIPHCIAKSMSLLFGHSIIDITDLYKKKYHLYNEKSTVYLFMTGGYLQGAYSCIIRYDMQVKSLKFMDNSYSFRHNLGCGAALNRIGKKNNLILVTGGSKRKVNVSVYDFLNDTVIKNSNTWLPIQCEFHCIVKIDTNTLILFNGEECLKVRYNEKDFGFVFNDLSNLSDLGIYQYDAFGYYKVAHKIYTFGGTFLNDNGKGISNKILSFDVKKNKWEISNINMPLPIRRVNILHNKIHNTLHIIGGENINGTKLDNHWIIKCGMSEKRKKKIVKIISNTIENYIIVPKEICKLIVQFYDDYLF